MPDYPPTAPDMGIPSAAEEAEDSFICTECAQPRPATEDEGDGVCAWCAQASDFAGPPPRDREMSKRLHDLQKVLALEWGWDARHHWTGEMTARQVKFLEALGYAIEVLDPDVPEVKKTPAAPVRFSRCPF